MSGDLKGACRLLGFPEAWAHSASSSGDAAVESLNATVNRIIRAHGCGSVVVSHEALANFTDAGISCLRDPQLAPLVASAVKEKAWKGLDEEREELLNIFREAFRPDIVRNGKRPAAAVESREAMSVLISAAARYQGHIHMLQTHFSRAEGSYSLPVDVRRLFNSFTQDESQLVRQYSEGLHRSQLTGRPPPQDPSHPQRVLFVATFTRLMELDKERAARASGVPSDDVATARTVESLYFSWVIEAWMELKALAVTGGRHLQGYDAVVWHPLERLWREWQLREGLLGHAVASLKLLGEDGVQSSWDTRTAESLAEGTQKLTLHSVSSLLYGMQPHMRFDPLGNGDADFSLFAACKDDEEAAVKRIVATAGKERAWRDIVMCIQPTQLMRQEAIESERVVITQRHALNAFAAIVNTFYQNPFHSHHYYHDGALAAGSSVPVSSELREVVALAKRRCGAADALHACFASFVNNKPAHPFLEELRRKHREEEPSDTTIINPLHPPFEIDFGGILSSVVDEGRYDFGLLRYKNRSSDADLESTREELRHALWAPLVPLAGREGDMVAPSPDLLRAGPLLVRILFWFVYCAFFNHKQVQCYNYHYLDLAGHAINTIVAYVTEQKISSVMSFAVKATGPVGSSGAGHQAPYRHHRGDSPSSIDFLPFAITHATLLSFFRTFPSNVDAFSEKTFVGPASLLLFELFMGRRGVPSTHYATLRRRMFEHPSIQIALPREEGLLGLGPLHAGNTALDTTDAGDTTPEAIAIGKEGAPQRDRADFLSDMIKSLNSHATNLSRQRAGGKSASRAKGGDVAGTQAGLALGAPSADGNTCGLQLSPTDESIVGEVRRMIAARIAAAKRIPPEAPSAPIPIGGYPKKSHAKAASSSGGASEEDSLLSPAEAAGLADAVVSKVCSAVSTAIAVAAENAEARASALAIVTPEVSDSFFYQERRVVSPQKKRRTTQYPKVRALTGLERQLVAATQAAIEAAASGASPANDCSLGNVSPIRRAGTASTSTKRLNPIAGRFGSAKCGEATTTRDDGGGAAVGRLRDGLVTLVPAIVAESIAAHSLRARRKEVDDANDIFVDEDFHILNTRLVADPDYARGILRQRRGSLGLSTDDDGVPQSASTALVVAPLGRANADAHTSTRALRLSELRERIHQTFDPSHRQSVGGVRSSTAISRLTLQLNQISSRIASRRHKLVSRCAGAPGSVPGSSPSPALLLNRSAESEGQSSAPSNSLPNSRPQSTMGRARRKTSSAIFSNSRKLSLFFNSDASLAAQQQQSAAVDVPEHCLVATEDDTMEGLEQELQALMLPAAAVQCCPDAAIVVQQLHKDRDMCSEGAVGETQSRIEGSPAPLLLAPPPGGGGAPKGTLAEHIFSLAAQSSALAVNTSSVAGGKPPSYLAAASRKPDIIDGMPHHQPFQQSRIYDLPSFTSEGRVGSVAEAFRGAPLVTAPTVAAAQKRSAFALEKDAIDTMFARPRSVAHFISRPQSQQSVRPVSTGAASPGAPRSQSAMGVHERIAHPKVGHAPMGAKGLRGRSDSVDPSVDPSLELNATAPALSRPMMAPQSAAAAGGARRAASTSAPLLPQQQAFGRPPTGIGFNRTAALPSATSYRSGARQPEAVRLPTPQPTRGGGRFLSPPRIAAPSNAAIEEVNLRSCSPAITRSVPKNARGARIHMLAVTCQPTMPPPGGASRLAQALRDSNTAQFKQEDDRREAQFRREMADIRSTARAVTKAEQEAARDLKDPLRRTDFVDLWIANEPPKVSAVDPRDEVRVRHITKGESDVSGRAALMWEGSRMAIEAKLNALELKEVIRGAERHVAKSTSRKKGKH